MSFLDTLAPQTNRIRFKSHFWLVYKASKMGETQNEKGLYVVYTLRADLDQRAPPAVTICFENSHDWKFQSHSLNAPR